MPSPPQPVSTTTTSQSSRPNPLAPVNTDRNFKAESQQPDQLERDVSAMSDTKKEPEKVKEEHPPPPPPPAATQEESKKEEAKSPAESKSSNKKTSKKSKDKPTRRSPKRRSKKAAVSDSESSSSSSSSSSSDSSDSSDFESSSSSEDESSRRKKKKAAAKKKLKSRRATKKSKHQDSSDEDSDSESSSSEEDVKAKKKSKRSRKIRVVEESEEESEDEAGLTADQIKDQVQLLQQQYQQLTQQQANSQRLGRGFAGKLNHLGLGGIHINNSKRSKKTKTSKKSSSKPEYFRADELWDSQIHAYRLRETADMDEEEFGDFAFHVRRRFDWEGKYVDTLVDIKSKPLRTALQAVMGNCKAISLAEETPSLDPNMLFLYLEDMRTHQKELKRKSKKRSLKKKERKLAARQFAELKLMIKYVDKDYAAIKKTLYPLREAGKITFELLWTLFRSDEIVYTSTYSAPDEPRAFKIEYATKESSFMKGTWYYIEGRYLDFDGKQFGLGLVGVEIESFKGTKSINALPCYPLKYHKEPEAINKQLMERGKKFVALAGMKYKAHAGIAFTKRKRQILKVCTNTRVMVDPQTFRRINPNYPISIIKAQDDEFDMPGYDSDDSDGCCGSDNEREFETSDRTPTRLKLVFDKNKEAHIVEVEVDENGNEVVNNATEKLLEDGGELKRDFTEEELLIASPVVLGFAFSEKMWLEFTVSGIQEIEWNEGAFESLVLPERQKSIVKALVQSHTSEAQERKTIDDVIKGKGKGLVAVLHGTPGVGKTLTAEGIAELLKRPLYSVSAGDLGTHPRELEAELTKILDVAHSWGAVLLLDEADVFMEARTAQDIHRNALVSIFLRVLEYFQGILFLTTNRVASFDDAFQSRIHIALRYQELDFKARRTIFKMFIERVADTGRVIEDASEEKKDESSATASEPPLSPAASSTFTSISKADAEPESSGTATPLATPPSPTISTQDGSATPRPGDSQTLSDKGRSPTPIKESKNTAVQRFTDADLDRLARREHLNGRQIKNAVRSAQALAVNEGVPMGMSHIVKVLEVAEAFERDLKGGTGYLEAMRSYT